MKLGIPQIILIGLYMMSLGIELARNGQDKTGKYNVGTSNYKCCFIKYYSNELRRQIWLKH